jgi:hypothetical protein
MLLVASCKTTRQDSEIREAPDSQNGAEIFGADAVNFQVIKNEEFTKGKLDATPWSDTYWPLNEAGFADRWIDSKTAPEFRLKTSVDEADYQTKVASEIKAHLDSSKSFANKPWGETVALSPAEKYDIGIGNTNFDLTKSELDSFAKNRVNYKDISWSWMGHCHGWAPASYLFDAPKQGVLVKNSSTSQEIMFTPGDVRGLLTKTASDNSFTERSAFMGTRCNDASADVPRDELNRVIDGALGKWQNGKFSSHVPVQIILNNWFNYNEMNSNGVQIVFKIGPNFDKSKSYWLEAITWRDRQKQVVDVDIYSTRMSGGHLKKDMLLISNTKANIGAKVDSKGQLKVDSSGTVISDKNAAKRLWDKALAGASGVNPEEFISFKSYKQCRDLNAGAFHTVLVQYLSKGMNANKGKKARSFVMDITRDDQVWNHAINSFESKMGEPTELTIKDGETNFVDPFLTWRASGTKYIVDVYSDVEYAIENGPRIIYAPSDEATSMKNWRYTLELDKDFKVIGGEWHGKSSSFSGIPKSGKELLEDLKKSISKSIANKPDSPDFIWRYTENAKFGSQGLIKPDFVNKVYECSIAATSTAQKAKVGDTEFEYVECSY